MIELGETKQNLQILTFTFLLYSCCFHPLVLFLAYGPTLILSHVRKKKTKVHLWISFTFWKRQNKYQTGGEEETTQVDQKTMKT